MRSFSCWRATRVRVRPLSPPLDAPRPPHPWVSPRLTASSSCTPGAGSLGVRACSAAPGAAALAEASLHRDPGVSGAHLLQPERPVLLALVPVLSGAKGLVWDREVPTTHDLVVNSLYL